MDRIAEKIFGLREPIFENLVPFGFEREGEEYRLRRPLPACGMAVCVVVSSDGGVESCVEDEATGERYTLFLVADSEGAFVGEVRSAYEAALTDISSRCFRPRVFKSAGAEAVLAHARKKYGSEPEFLWEDTPDCAILRRADNRKWYAVLMRVKQGKLAGCPGDGEATTEVCNVRVPPEELEGLLGPDVYPAYHMNKKHWVSLRLTGALGPSELWRFVDASYAIALKR